MKKRIAISLVLSLALIAGTAAAGTLRVGMECDYAPFNWTQAEPGEYAVPVENGGYADGYDVQIARRIADAMGEDLVILRVDWDGLTPALMSGEIDAIIAGMSPTAERALTIDFSDPYFENDDLVIVVRKNTPYADAESLADFAGAAITAQLNTFHCKVIEQIEGVSAQTPMETFPAMIVALTAGAIDGFVSETPAAISAAAANPNLTYVVFEEGNGFIASPEDVAVAVGLRKGSELYAPINEALAAIGIDERQRMMDDAVARQPLGE